MLLWILDDFFFWRKEKGSKRKGMFNFGKAYQEEWMRWRDKKQRILTWHDEEEEDEDNEGNWNGRENDWRRECCCKAIGITVCLLRSKGFAWSRRVLAPTNLCISSVYLRLRLCLCICLSVWRFGSVRFDLGFRFLNRFELGLRLLEPVNRFPIRLRLDRLC